MSAGHIQKVKNYKYGNLNIQNQNLISLEGCPELVTGYFDCNQNFLSSFEHFPKNIILYCSISRNNFKSFKDIDQHIKYIGRTLHASDMHITSGYSDLFGIDGLKWVIVDNDDIRRILNVYIKEKDLIEFQDEMIKSGYESYL